MKSLLRSPEELLFTAVAYSLLGVVVLCFFTVRWTKESYARLEHEPSVLRVFPTEVVPGATQRVTVLSRNTHFGPESTVRSRLPGVALSGIRFVSDAEFSFEIFVHDGPGRGEGLRVPIAIRSPREGGSGEELALDLGLTLKAEPLEFELFNLPREEVITTERDYALFGYRPRGYGPYHLTARQRETGRAYAQETRAEIEHLGVPLDRGVNTFELKLADALGREVRREVTVISEREEDPRSLLAKLGLVGEAHALCSAYSGKPTQWGSDPTQQMAASDCVLGNGPLGCRAGLQAVSPGHSALGPAGLLIDDLTGHSHELTAAGGCGGGSGNLSVRPPPNDYVTTLGEAERGGDAVLLHNGQYRDDVVDLYIPGRGLDFAWKRSYQSGIDLDGYLGKNWDFSWGAHFFVEYSGGTIPVRGRFSRGDCRRDLYDNAVLQSTRYVFQTQPVGYMDIETAVYTALSEVRQSKRNGFVQIFDQASGKLKSRADRYGNTISVIYDFMGRISRIKDTLNRYVDFLYYSSGDASGRLSRVQDFDGRAVTYEFKCIGSSVVLTKVLYPPANWTDDTTTPSWTERTNTSRTVSYDYDSTARLSFAFDGRGKTRAQNVYDGSGRVTLQYNYSSVAHSFVWWPDINGKVTRASYKNRSGNETLFYFDPANHLSTRRDVYYTSEGVAKTATTWITRGCTCTIPTAIQEPDNGYTTFSIANNGDVSEKREFIDNDPMDGYGQTPGSDIVKKAYFAPVDSSQFGVMTKFVGPRGFAAGASEDTFAITMQYDLKANPITITYPNTTNPTQTGHQEIRTYNSSGQLLTVSRPEGMLTTFTYYATGDTPANNLGYLKDLKVKFQDSAPTEFTRTFTYNAFGAKTKERDGRGKETTYTVDPEFLVTQMTTPSAATYGHNRYWSYNGEREVVRADIDNKKGSTVDTGNPKWQVEYLRNDAGVVATRKSEIDAGPWAEERFEFDNDFRITLSAAKVDNAVPPREAKVKYTLDERGLGVTMTKAPGSGVGESIEQRTFDDEGKLLKTTLPFRNQSDGSDTNLVVRRSYDVFDRLEEVLDHATDPASNYKQSYYDLASNVTKEEQFAAGDATPLRRTQNQFDEMDRRWRTIRGVAERDPGRLDQTTFEHDKANRLSKTTDDNGNITEMLYDRAGRVTQRLLPSINGSANGKNTESLVYDFNSNVLTRTVHEVKELDLANPEDFQWAMDYDDLNRLTMTTFLGNDGATGPNPAQAVETYDARGLVIRSVSHFADGPAATVASTDDYDGLGRRTKTTSNSGGTNPSPISVTVAYDLASNATGRTDADNRTTAYGFDDQNRVTMTTHPDGDYINLGYNQLGLAMTRIQGNGSELRDRVEYRYNEVGLNTRKNVTWITAPTWANNADYLTTFEDFTYDGVYRLVNANDHDSFVNLLWNSLDQMVEEKLKICRVSGGSQNCDTQYRSTISTWDDTGRRRKTVKYPISLKEFEFEHDALDRVSKGKLVVSPTDKRTMVRNWYEGAGLDLSRRDRGVNLDTTGQFTFRTLWTEDALNRVTQIKHQRIINPTTDLRTFNYTWGNGSSGRYWQISQSDEIESPSKTITHAYIYDNLGRISTDTRSETGLPTDAYEFSHTTWQFWLELKKNAAVAKSFSEVVSSPADGSHQLKSYQEPPAAPVTCSYDIAGNMTSDGSTKLYYYDHENRLVYIDSATDFWFRYDALGRRILEKEGATETLFYHDGVHIAEETTAGLAVNRISLFGETIDDVLYSGAVDGSGNLSNNRWPFVDRLGTVAAVVDDGGNVQSEFDYTAYGETARTGAEVYPYCFTGRRYIETAKLYDYRARSYDPKLGRFMQRDPIGIWGDSIGLGNGYAYAGNDSVNISDPFGEGWDNPEIQQAIEKLQIITLCAMESTTYEEYILCLGKKLLETAVCATFLGLANIRNEKEFAAAWNRLGTRKFTEDLKGLQQTARSRWNAVKDPVERSASDQKLIKEAAETIAKRESQAARAAEDAARRARAAERTGGSSAEGGHSAGGSSSTSDRHTGARRDRYGSERGDESRDPRK